MPDRRSDAAAPTALRVLIVDDEPVARSRIRLVLEEVEDVRITAECGDGPRAVRAIRAGDPDLVFLDVQMPGLGGFEVIDAVGVDRMPMVIFVTAYDEHALKAFEVHAFDYLLKPFDDDHLLGVLARARDRLRADRDRSLGHRLAALLGNGGAATVPAAARTTVRHFTVKDEERFRFVPASAVDWIEAAGNYVRLHSEGGTYRIRSTLGGLEERLDPTRFVRIHRSTIVNLDRVREVQPWFSGDYLAILATGDQLRVSRTYRDALLRPFR